MQTSPYRSRSIRSATHVVLLSLALGAPLAGAGCGASGSTADSGPEPGTGGAATGGQPGSGGSATGGATGSGGTTGTGGGSGGTGPMGGNSGGAIGTGGVVGAGGVASTGGSSGAGGVSESGGSSGSGGTTGSGGSASAGAGGRSAAGGTTGAGGTGATGGGGGIPAGFPTPTPANWAVCKSVAQQTSPGGAKVCPGGGDGPACIECLYGGDTWNSTDVATQTAISEAGNYAVTVAMGGATVGQTQIDAETNRVLLAPTPTSAGQSEIFSFVVNVRANEGQPTENVSAGYPGLDLYFSGPTSMAPEVSAVGYALVGTVDKPVMVYIASDSTACDQSDTDYAGWGQMLPQFFAPPVGVANYADSGESSGSFLNNSREWDAVKNAMVAGDWVLIQFGHNDGSTSSATFQANITQMVKDAKSKGATPVLVSPPARATFSGQTLSDQSSLHGADMKAVATAQNVPFIDLTTITTTWYNTLGPNGWQQYHALGTDKTHTNAAGAAKIAGFVTSAMSTQQIGVAQYLRP
jgi:lysophospholipase L1-like esterase